MRYLQQCVDDLKAANRSSKRDSPTLTSPEERLPPPLARSYPDDEDDEGGEDEDEDEDEEMSDAVSPKHTITSAPAKTNYSFVTTSSAIYPSDRSVYSTTTSPNLQPGDHRNYVATISPALHPSDPHHYCIASSIRSTATSPSIQASPAFGGQTPSQALFQNPFPTAPSSKNSLSGASGATFALTSPALGPQADQQDQEVTEALLMLNKDRRSVNAGGRGMSVKDLLR
jgi:hypothetical protein